MINSEVLSKIYDLRYQIEAICKFFRTEIVVLSESNNDKIIEEELEKDIISIIHSFSEKLDEVRRREVKSKIDEEFKRLEL